MTLSSLVCHAIIIRVCLDGYAIYGRLALSFAQNSFTSGLPQHAMTHIRPEL